MPHQTTLTLCKNFREILGFEVDVAIDRAVELDMNPEEAISALLTPLLEISALISYSMLSCKQFGDTAEAAYKFTMQNLPDRLK